MAWTLIKFFKQHLRPYYGLVAALIGIGLLFAFVFFPTKDGTSPFALTRYADDVIRLCGKESYPPSCYDRELPKLMDKGVSMEQVFAITKIIQDKVHNYYYCHVLGHNISAKETAKDPSKWTEVVARCPTGMCSNGCLHGAAQERFRNDVLTREQIRALEPELSGICEPGHERNFTGLEQASCYHSLGHLTMYITGADITMATGVCDAIAKKGNADYTQTCYEGAYMQIFQPLEPEDFGLVKNIPATTTASAEVFCDSFTGERRSACHRESWPLYRESLKTAPGFDAFCSLVPDATSTQRCYNAMFYVFTAQSGFDQQKITTLCNGFAQKRKGQCYGNAASRMVETDYRLVPEAVALCTIADTQGVGKRCYDELLFYSSFNFHKDSEAFKKLCTSLPSPWKEKCLAGEGSHLSPSQDDY